MKLKRSIRNRAVAKAVLENVPKADAEFIESSGFAVKIETPELDAVVRKTIAAMRFREKKERK